MGKEQSRRDDLEAVGYMLVELLMGELPWDKSGNSDWTDDEWFEHTRRHKKLLPLRAICQGCPKEFEQYLKYCRKLKFAEQPDYDYLCQLFRNVSKRAGVAPDGDDFDWAKRLDIR